jgi:hypothetical protein
MKVTAIIPSLYAVDKEYLKLCVESLRATVNWDIIVVTNGTKAPEPIDIDGVTLRLHTRDQGQCNAVNIGVQAVTPGTDYIFISNSDMYYAPGWDKNLRFEYPCFSPNLIEPENNNGSADPFLKLGAGFDLNEFDKQMVDNFVEHFTHDFENVPKSVVEQDGFNFPLFIKKDLWDLLGGYDVAYDPWGSNSDTDLQTRINLSGVIPQRLRDVLVYHFSNKSGTFDGTHQDYYSNNIDYFRDKFGFDRDQLGSDVWYNRDMIPEDVSLIRYKQRKYHA